MKHLLILLSILLLSSPVVGQETGVLYLWEISSGKVWKGFGDKDTQPKYNGQVENGKPNGQGTETSPDGDMYEGKYKDGKKHGQGTYTWSNGDKYVGKYKDGKRNGHGTSTKSNGDIHEGNWKNGLIDGYGTSTFPNGDKYIGEFKDNKNWNTTVYDKNGNFKGEFLNGVEQ